MTASFFMAEIVPLNAACLQGFQRDTWRLISTEVQIATGEHHAPDQEVHARIADGFRGALLLLVVVHRRTLGRKRRTRPTVIRRNRERSPDDPTVIAVVFGGDDDVERRADALVRA